MVSRLSTSLIDIRDFLRTHGAAPPPWESAEAVIEHLFALLRERTGDDRFWRDLKMLLARLEDRRFDATALANASALGVTDIDAVIDRLRAELGTPNGLPGGVRAFFDRPLGGVAVLGFLLLATSYSCFTGDGDGDGGVADNGAENEPDDDDNDDGQPADSDADDDEDEWWDDDYTPPTRDPDVLITPDYPYCDRAAWQGYDGQEAEIYCALIEIVEQSSISSGEKDDILECLPELSATRRAELLELFQEMDDTELAAYLEGMLDYGAECDDFAWDDDH
ncbi:hypothetical protein K8I61_03500 [bacterium]|nr:hypothetical protein [bacterium]